MTADRANAGGQGAKVPPVQPADARQLLAAARLLLSRPDADAAPVWPRVGAFLARQAVEQHVRTFWEATAPPVATCPARSQLVCLRGYVPADLAARTAHLWWLLTRACHHHAYELAPTVCEVAGWLHDTAEVLSAFDALAAPPADATR